MKRSKRNNDNEISEELVELLTESENNTEEIFDEAQEIEINEEEQFEDEWKNIPIVRQVMDVNNALQDLDDYFNQLPTLQSVIDEELSDLLHYIENNDLTPKQSVKMIKALKDKRLERRSLCNDYEIKKVYSTHRNKLTVDSQRQFFVSEICKKAKELKSTYRNRQLSDDDIKELLK